MFESPIETIEQAEKRQKLKILAATSVAFAAVIAAILYWSARQTPSVAPGEPERPLADAFRAGSPEFEQYRKFVTIEKQEGVQAENMLKQKIVVLRGLLANRGPRTLNGVEVKAVVYDFNNTPVAQRLAAPIPRRRPTLGPNESMIIEVTIDPVPPQAVISTFEIVLEGLKFQ